MFIRFNNIIRVSTMLVNIGNNVINFKYFTSNVARNKFSSHCMKTFVFCDKFFELHRKFIIMNEKKINKKREKCSMLIEHLKIMCWRHGNIFLSLSFQIGIYVLLIRGFMQSHACSTTKHCHVEILFVARVWYIYVYNIQLNPTGYHHRQTTAFWHSRNSLWLSRYSGQVNSDIKSVYG